METIYKFRLILLLGLILTVGACGQGTNMEQTSEQPAFDTPEKAIENAKTDFLSILKSGQEYNFGVDAASLEQSEAEELLRYFDLDFAKIMQADSTTTFEHLIASEISTIVPMAIDRKVVTIIELNKEDKGWRVVGLANQEVSKELNEVYRATNDTLINTITVYQIPNLNGNIYEVKNSSGNLYYTHYNDKFSLSQGVAAKDILTVLREDAIIFQREFGDQVKGKGLVK